MLNKEDGRVGQESFPGLFEKLRFYIYSLQRVPDLFILKT